jgi:hypothetical protein
MLVLSLAVPALASAQVQTFTATHTYILGDRDSKEDARQRCLLETKRKILEQAGVYIESASEVKDLQLTKDTITSFTAAVMQVKDTKEEVGFQHGHMTLTLTTTAQVDLDDVRKQLAARQGDAWVLWMESFESMEGKKLEYQAAHSYGTQEACEQVAKTEDESYQETMREWQRQGLGNGPPRINFLCLPDTIDPRGPKGK